MTTPTSPTLEPYDGIVLASFGGPEGPDEVMPFLRRVTAGRGIPDERLAEVAEHYLHFGGRSPINDQNRALIAALEQQLHERGLDTPILFGNRNSEPFLANTLREAGERGMERVVVLTTSAYSSYSSCRQYRENLATAVAEVEQGGSEHPAPGSSGQPALPAIDKVAQFAPRPGFAQAQVPLVVAAVQTLGDVPDAQVAVVFVTHSIPTPMDETSGPGDGDGQLYSTQHQRVGAEVLDRVNEQTGRQLAGSLAFCSRSGPPSQPWLEPDINDHLAELAGAGVTHVVCVPIGFVSDHMEVVYDLDTEAAATALELGVAFLRVPTVGTSEPFVRDLVDAVLDRAREARGEPVAEFPGRMPSVCAPGCCPNLRMARPALCGRD